MMDRQSVEEGLRKVAEARKEWALAQAKFNADIEDTLDVLLNEAAANRMSPEQIGRSLGKPPSRVRDLMRRHGLNPRDGKNVLAKQAAEALEHNAAVMGIDVTDIDLTSPLAYLPAGALLRVRVEK